MFCSVAGALLDPNDPRTTCFYIVIGIAVAGILISLVLLKESKNLSVFFHIIYSLTPFFNSHLRAPVPTK